jgi:lipopolysaccharide/colanic/teichoic acid biosynthesis glycosyltransferase
MYSTAAGSSDALDLSDFERTTTSIPISSRRASISDTPGYVLARSNDDHPLPLAMRVAAQARAAGVPLRLTEDRNLYFTVVKPLFDRAAAALMLLILSPLMLTIALLIKLSDGGPVFFAQPRTGHMAGRFRMLKFRTMVPGAEHIRASIRHMNMYGESSHDFKAKDDPRITRLGRHLRSTSLDELPNLINVLRGEMSLVGPRPTSFDAATYAPGQLSRLAVKPGITGLWQVSGRASIDFARRCDLDLDYIRTASAWSDFKLLLMTVGAVIRRSGAH